MKQVSDNTYDNRIGFCWDTAAISYYESDETHKRQLEQSFWDERFVTAMWFIAMKEDKVIGRVDASLISSRGDAFCFSACMDWICAQKYEETAIIVK